MKVKKYIASTMPEAMNQVKKELGESAVILDSREIKTSRFFGLFGKRNIEVLAQSIQSRLGYANLLERRSKRQMIQ